MPSRSPAQHRLMEAAAHDSAISKRTGIPQTVAREFVAADEHSERKRGKKEAMQAKPAHGYGR